MNGEEILEFLPEWLGGSECDEMMIDDDMMMMI